MKRPDLTRLCSAVFAAIVGLASASGVMAQPAMTMTTAPTPIVGTKAPDFSLRSPDGALVRLSDALAQGPVVLVVLRGWPGYQCPVCTRQFGSFMGRATALDASGARVLFVYPGPADDLDAHAREFVRGKQLPGSFTFLLDPAYAFTQSYGLRWDAPQETAYPATFVIDRDGVVRYAKVSRTHGDRAPVDDVLAAVAALNGSVMTPRL
jgi:peroxiredoxin Q/BCP